MSLEDQLAKFQQEFKLLWGNRRDFLIALFLILVAVAIGYYLAYPEFDKISGNQEKVTTVQEEIDNLDQRSQAWRTALNNSDYQEKADLVNKILPSYKPVLESIYLFNDLLGDHPGVRMTKFDFAPGEIATSGAQTAEQRQRRTGNSRNYLVINFNLSGMYEDVLKFLQDSEKTAPIGSVAEAQISKNVVGMSSAKVTYYAYYYDQPTSAKTTSINLPKLTGQDSENLADFVNYYLLKDIEMDQTLDPTAIKNDLFSEVKQDAVRAPAGGGNNGVETEDSTETGGSVSIDMGI